MTDSPAMPLPDDRPDNITLRYWAGFYVCFLLATGIPLYLMLSHQAWPQAPAATAANHVSWYQQAQLTYKVIPPHAKLLIFCIYMSLCCTFLPLPTTWLVAGMAARQFAVGDGLWSTTLAVATAGAIGSTIANLNDYHLLTWMLRSRKVAKARNTRVYHAAAKWFARAPFFLVTVFNLLPIPVDAARLLAAAARYPRVPFAVANFIGRFGRYGLVAFLIYAYDLGKIAIIVLLALAVVLGAIRVLPPLIKKVIGKLSRTPRTTGNSH